MASSTSERLVGMVKWFNSRAGYGFITVCGEDRDIFVHYSNIKSGNYASYTYLTQGEYVEFDLANTENETHKFQAVNITGIRGGPIMCESRKNNRPKEESDEKGNGNGNSHDRTRRPPRPSATPLNK